MGFGEGSRCGVTGAEAANPNPPRLKSTETLRCRGDEDEEVRAGDELVGIAYASAGG